MATIIHAETGPQPQLPGTGQPPLEHLGGELLVGGAGAGGGGHLGARGHLEHVGGELGVGAAVVTVAGDGGPDGNQGLCPLNMGTVLQLEKELENIIYILIIRRKVSVIVN